MPAGSKKPRTAVSSSSFLDIKAQIRFVIPHPCRSTQTDRRNWRIAVNMKTTLTNPASSASRVPLPVAFLGSRKSCQPGLDRTRDSQVEQRKIRSCTKKKSARARTPTKPGNTSSGKPRFTKRSGPSFFLAFVRLSIPSCFVLTLFFFSIFNLQEGQDRRTDRGADRLALGRFRRSAGPRFFLFRRRFGRG